MLAGDIAHAARRHPATRTRIAIDGAVESDTHDLAGRVVAVLADLGLAAFHVRAADFLRSRSIRLETGSDDPDAGYWRWVDHDAIQREVLIPFCRTGRFLPSLRDRQRDRPTRVPPVDVPEQAVLVVSGPMLLRTEIVDELDVRVHLLTSPAALSRRIPEDSHERVVGAWGLYQEWDQPMSKADLVVRYDHPERPAVGPGGR